MSWGDPWVQAFQGISRAAENYGAIKYSEQREELAKKAREEAERLAKENEVVWKGFSPEGDYMEMTRGQAMGGGKLPAFELDRQKAEQSRLQAEAEAKTREQEAKIGSYESRAAADQARGQASLSRAALDDAKRTRPQDFLSQGGRGGGLAKTDVDRARSTVDSLSRSGKKPEDIMNTIVATYGVETARQVLPGLMGGVDNAKEMAPYAATVAKWITQ